MAFPFLRPPEQSPLGGRPAMDSTRVTNSFSASATQADEFAEGGFASIVPGRVVSGKLPSTVAPLDDLTAEAPPKLPPWVLKRSALDDLITAGRASDPSALSGDAARVDLQELRPWRGDGLARTPPAQSPTQPPHQDQISGNLASPWQDRPTASTSDLYATPTSTVWPDQTLDFDVAQLQHSHVAPHPANQQHTVAAKLNTPALRNASNSGAASSSGAIGASLSRSGAESTGHKGVAQTAPVPKQFVYQPGLKP